jgi:predicted DNA-binding transcriptional regulator YafY
MSGARDSQWHVLRRCLQIIVTLQHAPTPKQALATISAGDDDTLTDTALDSRLQKDLKRLREVFGCTITYHRDRQDYTLDAIDFPLIDISPKAIQGLAFLQTTFHDDAPMGTAVQQFIDEIKARLPEARRSDLRRHSRTLLLDLSSKDEDEINDVIWDTVQAACESRRLLEFDYYSPNHDDGEPRHNLVEPHRTYFDTQRGHFYLYAYRLRVTGPHGSWDKQTFLHYRLGRIADPHMLPGHFTSRQKKNPQHELIYELSPQIARFGVTHHFPNCEITPRDDGGVEVRTKVDDLFMPLKTLLHYGPGCRVTGGREAVARMRDLVHNTWKLYELI